MKYTFGCLTILTLGQLLAAAVNTDEDFIKHAHKVDTECKSHYNGTILYNPLDCHKFYVCVDHQPHEYSCDPNYHFDKNTRSCVPGYICNNSIELDRPAKCTEGAVRAVADDCYSFETCVNGQYQRLNCHPGYYFDATHAICRSIQYDALFQCNCIVPEHTVLKNKANCQTFFLCENRKPVLQKCPENQYYESRLNACLPDLDGDCIMAPTISPPRVHYNKVQVESLNEITVESATQEEDPCKSTVGTQQRVFNFTPFSGDCSKFQICVNGQVYTRQCPSGMYYDVALKYCVVDSENKCGNAKLPQEISASHAELSKTSDTSKQVSHEQPTFMEEEIMLPPNMPAMYQGNYAAGKHNKLFSKFIKF